MKLKSILSASLFAAIAALSPGLQAASDMDKGTAAKPPVADTQADKAAKMKPHSHVEEKTGMPQSASPADPDKPNPAKDMTKHNHPRDAK